MKDKRAVGDGAGLEEAVFRGSIVKLRRRCGTKGCHCQKGDLHETWALSYSVKGKTHMVTLRDNELEMVRRGLRRYRVAVAELERRAIRGIAQLRKHLDRSRKGGK